MKNIVEVFFFIFVIGIYAQDSDDLDLVDKDDLDALTRTEELDLDAPDSPDDFNPPKSTEKPPEIKESDDDLDILKDDDDQNVLKKEDTLKALKEEDDDLEALKEDIGESLLDETKESEPKVGKKKALSSPEKKSPKVVKKKRKRGQIFDVGQEEKELLELSKYIMGKIPPKDWNEITTSSKNEKYVVQKGDWLWKISKRLFGTGFYYSKIWALNPHITNPHEIEPGTVLIFSTGDEDEMPFVRLGKFAKDSSELSDQEDFNLGSNYPLHPWFIKRQELIKQGVFFQFTSDITYKDLERIGMAYQTEEYKKYEPPLSSIISLKKDGDGTSDTRGFDKSSRIDVNFAEGFYLTTFITSNIIEDLGELTASAEVSGFITAHNRVFVRFDPSVKVRPGDYYSIYSADGRYSHPESERSGYRYTITAQIRALEPKDDLWKCDIVDISGIVERKSRITKYTPKIEKIVKTFSKRTIEGVIIGAVRNTEIAISYGDVVFIDRGRMDGVENGTVFEIFSSLDEGTGEQISIDPSYKTGELTVVTLTDNFSTALVTNSSSLISLGTFAVSKSVESAARTKIRLLRDIEKSEKTLDDLDLELKIDDIGQDLLDKADKIQLTDDELDMLERQEREKSVIQEHERDIKELDRLESEIEQAEGLLNEAKVDEDKFLEQQNLNYVEKRSEDPDANAFESLDEVEKELGLKFMDEDLNAKENPYGLTENDLEEVDELIDKGKE